MLSSLTPRCLSVSEIRDAFIIFTRSVARSVACRLGDMIDLTAKVT